MRHLHNRIRERWELRLRNAGFLFGGVKLYFDHHRQPFVCFTGCVVKFQRQRCVVDGINPVKQARSSTRFVALQMPDQVPACLQVRELRLLLLPFLDAIFTERAHAGIVRGTNRFRGNRFCSGHQDNFLRPAIRAGRRARDAFADLFDVGRDCRCARHKAF